MIAAGGALIDLGPAWSMKSYNLRRASVIITLGGQCANCGTAVDLQVHHPEGNGDSHGIGGWKQLRKIEAEIKAGVPLELLCGRKAKDCHRKEHDKKHLGELPGAFTRADQEEG
jgi:hypothetical protein